MRSTRSFEPAPESIRAVRRFTAEALTTLDPATFGTVSLLTSELATNVVRHVRTPFSVSFEQTNGRLRVSVDDDGRGDPVVRVPTSDEVSGRGLLLVNGLSDAWGVTRRAEGKTVWFEVTLRGDDTHRA